MRCVSVIIHVLHIIPLWLIPVTTLSLCWKCKIQLTVCRENWRPLRRRRLTCQSPQGSVLPSLDPRLNDHLFQSPPIMFSRLDSERNAKTMKRAVIEQKLDPSAYRVCSFRSVYGRVHFVCRAPCIRWMSTWISQPNVLPTSSINTSITVRWSRLSVSHQFRDRHRLFVLFYARVENVRKKKNLDENVFNTLEKMEDLQKDVMYICVHFTRNFMAYISASTTLGRAHGRYGRSSHAVGSYADGLHG